MRLNSKQLRNLDSKQAETSLNQAQNQIRNPIYFIVEDVYDTYNVGGLFRLADALNITKVYLCGETEIPPNHKIVKASIGTYKIVPWEYKSSAQEAVAELRNSTNKSTSDVSDSQFTSDVNIIAVEQAKDSIDYRKANYKAPIALIVGNETNGVKSETLKLCDQIVEIPMYGINVSLNVIVSAAVVGYHAVSVIQPAIVQKSLS